MSTCIAIVGKLSFLCLRLPFGTVPTPAEYTTTNEAPIELDNDLLVNRSWGATNLQFPHKHLLPREDYLPASEPLVKADQMAVKIKAKEASMDGFVDDITNITINDPCWVECTNNAA